MLFLRLSADIIAEIIVEWLHAKDWARIDVALTSTEMRPLWLSVVASDGVILSVVNSLMPQCLNSFARWCNRRSISNVSAVSVKLEDVNEPWDLHELSTFLTRYGPNIRTLEFRSLKDYLSLLLLFGQYCSGLHTIVLQDDGRDKLGIGMFLTNVSESVQSLTLLATTDATRLLGTSFSSLRVLALSKALNALSISDILSNSPALKELWLVDMDDIDDILRGLVNTQCRLEVLAVNVENSTEPDYNTMLDAFGKLEHLHVVFIFGIESCIDDDTIKVLVTHCPLLHALYIDGATNITDASMLLIAEHCRTKLTHFGVVNCPLVSLKDGVMQIGKCCAHLTDLSIGWLSDGGNEHAIVDLVLVCPRLQALDLSGHRITSAILKALAKCSENLVFLGLDFLKHDSELNHLGDVAVAAVKLRRLSVTKHDPSLSSLLCDFWRCVRPGLNVVHYELSPFWNKYLLRDDD